MQADRLGSIGNPALETTELRKWYYAEDGANVVTLPEPGGGAELGYVGSGVWGRVIQILLTIGK